MGGSSIQVERLSKRYSLGHDPHSYITLRETLASSFRLGRSSSAGRPAIWALQDVSFGVDEGEVIGVIGPNGAGKSTLLKVLSRITQPTAGLSRTRGRVGALLEVGTGFHPELSGRENIYLNGAILGLRRREIRRRFAEIVDFAGVEQFLDTPLKRYSSGMYLRLAFAVAAHVDPDIVIVDEVLAVGDMHFREKCLGKMSEFGNEGRTVVFVSHDLGAINRLCDRALWLDRGEIRSDGRSEDVVERYVRSAMPRAARSTFALEPGKRVQLLSAAVTDGRGDPLDAPRRREPLTLSVRFVVSERIPGLSVALIIRNWQGVHVLDEDWGADTGGALLVDRVPQEYEAQLTVPPVLPAGEYVAEVWIGSGYETLVRQNALAFRIWPLPDDTAEAIERNRAAQPPVEWKITRLELDAAGRDTVQGTL